MSCDTFKNKVHYGLGVFKAVGMVSHLGFVDDVNGASECPIPLFYDRRILDYRYHLVRIAYHVQNRNLGLGNRLQLIDRVSFKAKGFLFRQVVGGKAAFSGADTGFAFSLAGRPTLEITHRGIAVNAGHLPGVGGSPVIDDQATATHAFQCRLF